MTALSADTSPEAGQFRLLVALLALTVPRPAVVARLGGRARVLAPT